MNRRLLILASFLLVGAVVNVAVAWGCAAFAEFDKQASFHVAERPGCSSVPFFVMVHRRSGFGLDQVAYPPTETVDGLRAGVQHTRPDLPRWALWPRELVDQTILYVAAGWPLKAVVGQGVQGRMRSLGRRGQRPKPPVWKGAFVIEDKLSGVPPIGPNQQMIPLAGYRQTPWNTSLVRLTPIPARVLPWRPLPPGFAINTLFYAALLWLLIPGPFALRRLLRVRRGLCPKCAYPMGESVVCTECGKPVPSRVRLT